jgi:hypothetical protein
VFAADVNQDGHQDLLTVATSGAGWYLYANLGHGDGTFGVTDFRFNRLVDPN